NLSQKSTIRLYVKDYAVKDVLTKQVLEKFKSLIFISGTLKFNHSFEAFKQLFNKDVHFNTFEVNTSLQSAKNTSVFIPSDVASYQYKNIDEYVASIVSYIIEYTTITSSKCLVLFTSYKMMHMVQDMLNELPEFEDYVVLTQQQN
ncbi:ATP-dependent helicase, partial [Staphylococcus aureus]